MAFIALLFTVAAESIFKLWASIFYSSIPDVKSMSFETMGPSLAAETWISAALVGLIALFFHLHRKYQSVSAKAKGSSKKDSQSKTADTQAGVVSAFNNFYYHLSKHGGLTAGAFVILVALISTVDLWREDSKFINVVSLDSYLREDGVTRYLDQQGDNFRVFMFPDTYGNQNYLAYYGTEQVFGYHGNQLKRYDDFTERIMIQSARTPEQFQKVYGDMFYGNKLDLLNVRYVVSPFPLNDYKFQQVYNYANVYLNQNKLVLPRARVVFQYEVIEDTEEAQRRARSREFDYRNSVVLDKEPGIDTPQDSAAYVEAKITNDIINNYDVQVKMDKPGILILSENYYPAWKATINDKPVDILLADGNFMAIPVEAGEHTVHIEFDSDYYNYSSLITRLTWLLYLGTAVYFLVINRRQRGKNNERSD
ncbi:MAG: YfhO family protein [candidate division Zixibacteria bacterium]|nr:YfhO family protein [candidate division Zixibacteria bacterium]